VDRVSQQVVLSWLDAPPFADPSDDLRFDEELLREALGVMRIWETSRECVVLGHGGQQERDVHLAACRRSGIPVLRRCSGGGAVLLGPGCLNYSLVLPLEWDPKWRDVRYSLGWAMARMKRALGVPELRYEGQCDLTLKGRKVSGNAQRRTHRAILHHGTLLYAFDATRAERFLKPPVHAPPYRAGRTHREFLGNLPLTSGETKQRLVTAWCRESLTRFAVPLQAPLVSRGKPG
jgi:lipoate---protein ligase